MKRLLFAGLLGVITSLGLRAGEPTTMWPYLFDDFMEASIYSKSGNKGEAKVNIHLLRNDLHYLNGSQIYCPDNQNDIGRVVFADSTEFVRCENFFIEVLGETPQAILGRRTTGDFDRLLQGTGAYGTSSSTSAVDNLSSLQLGGIANGFCVLCIRCFSCYNKSIPTGERSGRTDVPPRGFVFRDGRPA